MVFTSVVASHLLTDAVVLTARDPTEETASLDFEVDKVTTSLALVLTSRVPPPTARPVFASLLWLTTGGMFATSFTALPELLATETELFITLRASLAAEGKQLRAPEVVMTQAETLVADVVTWETLAAVLFVVLIEFFAATTFLAESVGCVVLANVAVLACVAGSLTTALFLCLELLVMEDGGGRVLHIVEACTPVDEDDTEGEDEAEDAKDLMLAAVFRTVLL
jgi:hypothetical protein